VNLLHSRAKATWGILAPNELEEEDQKGDVNEGANPDEVVLREGVEHALKRIKKKTNNTNKSIVESQTLTQSQEMIVIICQCECNHLISVAAWV